MNSVSSTSGIQSTTQLGWQQARLQQAQRNADQAESAASALQARATAARREADRAQQDARELGLEAGRARMDAGRARQSLALVKSEGNTQAGSRGPILNAQGQATGKVIDTLA